MTIAIHKGSPSETSAGPVVVVYGGTSSEREISLRTGRALLDALVRGGIDASGIDLQPGGLVELLAMRPSAVVIGLHGTPGEDGSLQGALEFAQIPYTGSGVLASALAMDKVRSKQMFEAFGVSTPPWCVVDPAAPRLPSDLSLPVVVKPSLEGSSVGVAVARDVSEFDAACRAAGACRGDVLVEKCIEGRELTVAMLDGVVLGIVEVTAAEGFYDYDAKYRRGDTTYRFPATLEADVQRDVEAQAVAAWNALGCRGIGRADVMLDQQGRPYVLEVNTLPGMTETSLVPKVARGIGLSFEELALRILSLATTDALAGQRQEFDER